jgi:hypothetical protein
MDANALLLQTQKLVHSRFIEWQDPMRRVIFQQIVQVEKPFENLVSFAGAANLGQPSLDLFLKRQNGNTNAPLRNPAQPIF